LLDWIEAIIDIPTTFLDWREGRKAKKKDAGESKPPPSDRQPHDPQGEDDSSPFIR
jgi:hypothetical protein